MWTDINIKRRVTAVHRAGARAAVALLVGGALSALPVSAQDALQLESTSESSFDPTPQTRMRPIGEPSLVDQYRSASPSQHRSSEPSRVTSKSGVEEAGHANSARYASRPGTSDVPSLQHAYGSTMADDGSGTVQRRLVETSSATEPLRWSAPQRGVSSETVTSTEESSRFPVRRMVFQAPADQVPNAAPALPVGPGLGGGMGMPEDAAPLPGTSAIPESFAPVERAPSRTMQDTAPVPMPRLEDQMATIDNCNCISGPSGYTAGGYWGCGTETTTPVIYSQPGRFVAPPAMIAPPVTTPAMAPMAYSPTNAGYRPLFTLGQDAYNAQLGRGIIGQPTAYVPGQHFRNFLRYLSP